MHFAAKGMIAIARKFIDDFYRTFVLHAVAAHFNNGLLPSALLFLGLAILRNDPFLERTVLHLICLAVSMVPVSFLSGVRDWRTKFHGARAPIFYRKMWLTALLSLLSGSAVLIRLSHPDVLFQGGALSWLYLGCLGGTLPVVVLLGHYGGKLAFRWKQMNG
jgi:hypothetical protein